MNHTEPEDTIIQSMTFGSGKRCKAKSKQTGEQCKNPAVAGQNLYFLRSNRLSNSINVVKVIENAKGEIINMPYFKRFLVIVTDQKMPENQLQAVDSQMNFTLVSK
ncbi:MAG: hypothetical protein AB1546_11340 [bacterium]